MPDGGAHGERGARGDHHVRPLAQGALPPSAVLGNGVGEHPRTNVLASGAVVSVAWLPL